VGINVLIADQQRTFADALATRLDDEDDIQVVGAVQVEAPGPWLIAGKSIDVMVLDGDLPGGAANRLCAEISGRREPMRVVTLSSSSEPDRIVAAIRAGSDSWVRKDQSLEDLLRVIRGAAHGESWLPPSETGNVVRLLLQEQDRHREKERQLATLTPRERAVLACLAEGAEHRVAVAQQLHLSVNTVRTHLQNLMAKLGVHSALEAVALMRDQTGCLPANGSSSLVTHDPNSYQRTCVMWGMYAITRFAKVRERLTAGFRECTLRRREVAESPTARRPSTYRRAAGQDTR
jgi:DNA-binding NarL/FixJ family response regulator